MPSKVPTKKKELYLGKCIGDLNKLSDIKQLSNSVNLIVKACEKVFREAELFDGEGDEEKAFVMYMKYFNLLQQINVRPEYKKQKTYYDALLGAKNQNKAIERAEKLCDSLKNRYDLRDAEKAASKLQDEVSPKETKNSEKQSKQPSQETENSKETPSPSATSTQTVSCTQLCELLRDQNTHMILMDVRSGSDFDQSHISHTECISVPQEIVLPGSTVNHIEVKLPSTSKPIWQNRKNADHIILLDWNSKLDDVKIGTPMKSLKDALFKFDTSTLIKSEPLILDGGYEQWLLFYPMLTTNAHVSMPSQPNKEQASSPTMTLDFDYPDFDEGVENTVSATTESPSSINLAPLVPLIDRSLKPSLSLAANSATDKGPSAPAQSNNPSAVDSNSSVSASNTALANSLYPSVNLSSNTLSDKFAKISMDETQRTKDTNNALEMDFSRSVKKRQIKEGELKDFLSSRDKVLLDREKKIEEEERKLKSLEKIKKKEEKDVADLMRMKRKLKEELEEQKAKQVIERKQLALEEDKRTSELKRAEQEEEEKKQRMARVDQLRTERKLKELEKGRLRQQEDEQKIEEARDLEFKLEQEKQAEEKMQQEYEKTLKEEEEKERQKTKELELEFKKQEEKLAQAKKEEEERLAAQKQKREQEEAARLEQKRLEEEKKEREQAEKERIFQQEAKRKAHLEQEKETLPPGWEKMIDKTSNRYMYIDHNNEKTHWELPAHLSVSKKGTYTARLKEEPTTPTSRGLSRSHSSPDIMKQLADEEKARRAFPLVDRGNKPVPNLKPKIMKPAVYSTRKRDLNPVYGNVGQALTGLRNLGNTCYMNSTIQCLSNNSPLVNYFLSDNYVQDVNRESTEGMHGEVVDDFAIVIRALWSGQYRSITPRDLKNTVGKYNPMFAGYQQQDSQEFLTFLLDGLHEGLNEVKNPPEIPEQQNDNLTDAEAAKIAWQHHKLLHRSFIVELFQGQLKSTLMCRTCHKTSVTFQTFMNLSLPIPASSKSTLNDCLREFLKPEMMTGSSKWKCPRCRVERDSEKKIDIWKLPPILLISLNRFYSEGMWMQKKTTYVDFPLSELDIASYISGPPNGRRYNLYGTSNHYGTMEGGHYTAFCRNPVSKKWYKFDDQEVHEMSRSDVKTSAAFVLHYTSVEMPPPMYNIQHKPML